MGKIDANKFKVGDTVRVLRLPSPEWAFGRYSVGQEFAVIQALAGETTGEQGQLIYGVSNFYMRADDVELVESTTAPAEPKEQRAPCGCASGCLGYVCGFRAMPVFSPPIAKVDPYDLPRGATHPLLGRHDPYTGRFLDKEIVAYALQKADDEIEGRRARLVAALAKELDRPAPVRFPHPGRNFELKGAR